MAADQLIRIFSLSLDFSLSSINFKNSAREACLILQSGGDELWGTLAANLEICTLDGCAPCFAAIRAKDGWHA